MAVPFKPLFQKLDEERINRLAERYDIDRSLVKKKIIDKLYSRMISQGRLRKQYNELGDDIKAVGMKIIADGGQVTRNWLQQSMGVDSDLLDKAKSQLEDLGFLFTSQVPGSGGLVEIWSVPDPAASEIAACDLFWSTSLHYCLLNCSEAKWKTLCEEFGISLPQGGSRVIAAEECISQWENTDVIDNMVERLSPVAICLLDEILQSRYDFYWENLISFCDEYDLSLPLLERELLKTPLVFRVSTDLWHRRNRSRTFVIPGSFQRPLRNKLKVVTTSSREQLERLGQKLQRKNEVEGSTGYYRLSVVLKTCRTGRSVGTMRRFELNGLHTLSDLHYAIQKAFGWGWDHAAAFFMSDRVWDSDSMYDERSNIMSNSQLRDFALKRGDKFKYVFDFGTEKIHQIRVLEADPNRDGPERIQCVASRGKVLDEDLD